ncbi:MAG: hypothetical protein WA919_04270 [Coleofasciculaceae cyanobacterium]
MLPNLLEATQDYWRKLDELEAAYKKGEVSPQEVDVRVHELMRELGQERRASLSYVLHSWRKMWNEQRETILGLACLGVVTYLWVIWV